MTRTIRTSIVLAAALVGLMPGPAHAGRGGSAPRIASAVRSGSVDAIIAEIERAERLICDACTPVVMDLLDSERYELREVAAWWFARRPALAADLHTRAVTDLAGGDGRLARNAADLLGTFRHPRAIDALATAAARSTLAPEARAAAARALGTIGHPRGAAALATAMRDGDPAVRLAAVTAWTRVRGQTGAAPAVALLADAAADVRATAAATVGQVREASGRAALETALAGDADPNVRRNAAWALGRLGDPASRAALSAAVADPSSLVRATARAALAELR